MIQLPQHYQQTFKTYLKYAVIMTVFSLLMGIVFQESSKKAPVSALLPAGAHLEAILSLALVHGHAFMIGVLVPMTVTWMLSLGFWMGFPAISKASLEWGTRLYLPSSAVALLLMIYKGYHYVLGVRSGQTDFVAMHNMLFGGSHALRAIAYGVTHTVMAIGLGIIVIQFWKTLSKQTRMD
jgi:hypothetical protein